MLDEETYKKEIVRMWDTHRDEGRRGYDKCHGVKCEECPLYTLNTALCENSINAFEIIKAVEKWSKEHQPLKLTRLEFEILKWLDKEGYKYIVRSPSDNLMAHDSIPKKVLNGWISENRYKTLTSFIELFQFIQWHDKEPTSIQDVLRNCEVADD